MTIDQSVNAITIALFALMVLAGVAGWTQIRAARRLPYFLLRRRQMSRGWRWLMIGVVSGIMGVLAASFGKQTAYRIIPPTPSITPSPTITGTPTITPTPSVSPTPTITPTPQLPQEIRLLLRETQTPNPQAAFSLIQVAERLDGFNRPIRPQEDFENPVGRLYGAFTYDNLQDGVRWTAIWYLGDEVVRIETKPWDGGTGGYGYTECDPGRWEPGEYEIRIFYGES